MCSKRLVTGVSGIEERVRGPQGVLSIARECIYPNLIVFAVDE